MGEVSFAAAAQALVAQLAIFQALLLWATAVHKAVKWSHSRNVVRQFIGVAPSMTGSALAIAIAAEAVGGALLVFPAGRAAGAALAALIWSVYLAFIFRAILQDRRDIDCGCSFGSTSRPLGAYQAARNAVLAGLALFIAGVSVMSGAVPVLGSQVLAGAALLALYGALDQVMALQPLRSGELL
ncbi:MAG: hypothetical protein JWN43_2331 [Gammaproteobacteria bacterium]|nr:hypothetical protein [Gammaproteobacteria bacterium]